MKINRGRHDVNSTAISSLEEGWDTYIVVVVIIIIRHVSSKKPVC